LTGPAALWSDFNEANKAAMMKSEALSWPLTLALLVLAFGTLVAAGLPLLLTMAGLIGAGGLLFLTGQVLDVSIWAMNFAMMFAIALGIDYALFIVVRFRGALAEGLSPRDATVHTMATAGKAVLASGLTVIAALLAVMLVPVPTFRSVPLGIVLAVLCVLAATLTLLPATLSALGHRINGGRIRVRGGAGHRSERFAAWGRRLWARPLPYAAGAVLVLLLLAAPALGLRTGMPTIGVVPEHSDSREGHALVVRAFGPGAPGQLQVVVHSRDLTRATVALRRDRRIAAVTSTDSVPARLDGGRRRAAAEGLVVTFEPADAENLPYGDASFDVVLSTFGVMFAPDHQRTAGELMRVCRPGGRIGLACWTPTGFLGDLFRAVARHVPPVPGVQSPLFWGTDPHIRTLFQGAAKIEHTPRDFVFRYKSAEHFVDVFRAFYGPVHKAFLALDAAGQAALEADLLALLRRADRGGQAGLVVPAEYLETVITR
jgi:SAM-dependent methyltransferase